MFMLSSHLGSCRDTSIVGTANVLSPKPASNQTPKSPAVATGDKKREGGLKGNFSCEPLEHDFHQNPFLRFRTGGCSRHRRMNSSENFSTFYSRTQKKALDLILQVQGIKEMPPLDRFFDFAIQKRLSSEFRNKNGKP
jgi:hypothetical protein